MTPEQKAAYLVAQIGLMTDELEKMLADSRKCDKLGLPHTYTTADWKDFNTRWVGIIGPEAVLEFFKQP